MTIEAMELLRHGIVARACMDYDTAIRYLARAPELMEKLEIRMEDLEDD